MINILWGILGMTVVLGLALLLSVDRRKIKVRTVLVALGIQVFFAVLVLYVPWGQTALGAVTRGVQAVIDQAQAGIDFLFGDLVEAGGAPFALTVLPIIIFFASLTAVLYHLRILQLVVRFIGGGLQKVLGTSRAESMNAAANIFVGQTEAPLVIRPYIAGMTKSELFAVMVGGLSTVAGSVLVGYSQLGADLEYLIAACFMAAPGALLMAKIIVPAGSYGERDAAVTEKQEAEALSSTHSSAMGGARYTRSEGAESQDSAEGAVTLRERPGAPSDVPAETSETPVEPAEPAANVASADPDEEPARNVIDAAARGASDGLKLAANVGAMLLAFISLIALLNVMVGGVSGWFGLDGVTIEGILGYIFAPVMWVVGVPWGEAVSAGSFLGQKIVLNEFVAFADFGPQVDSFSPKAAAVITFALTGFANLSSLAILLGGLGMIAKNRRSDIAQLGLRAVAGGTLANLMSAAIVGMIIVS